MAQVAIREFDAKTMFFESIKERYTGIQIRESSDIHNILSEKHYVIKPDMLFGKRKKLGLVGVNLDQKEIKNYFEEYKSKEIQVDGVRGNLEVFLAEEFVVHTDEYYISFEAKREGDVINFSQLGGVDIEKNWESVRSIQIAMNQDIVHDDIEKLCGKVVSVQKIIMQLWHFYKNYGFVYLEVNPFCFGSQGNVMLLDMVAKIDDQEYFLQKHHWKNLEIPNTFGFHQNPRESYIQELDRQTGASLKFKILNPQAKIWTLLAGGGASLVITDSLGALGFTEEIGNYGELSGNPTRDFTREYTRVLFEQMIENGIKGKYLIIAGAIANFTDIATTFSGIIDILIEKKEEILEQNIQLLIRRGGINEKKGLQLIKDACEQMNIPCIVSDSSTYMTDILQEITDI